MGNLCHDDFEYSEYFTLKEACRTYFLLLLFACHDFEQHSDPFTQLEFFKLKYVLKDIEEFEPVINELIIYAKKYSNNFDTLQTENIKLATRVSELEKRVERLEKQQRRKKVIVFGVQIGTSSKKAVDTTSF